MDIIFYGKLEKRDFCTQENGYSFKKAFQDSEFGGWLSAQVT